MPAINLAIPALVILSAVPVEAETRDNDGNKEAHPLPFYHEDFESYRDDAALWARGGPYLNQWRKTAPAGCAVRLVRDQFSRSGRAAVELIQSGDAQSPYSNAVLYYRVPLAMIEPHGRLGISGWISCENLGDARLFFLNELWTGRQPPVQEHFGHKQALLAGGIQYHSRKRKWQWEHGGGEYPYADFSEPMEYPEGLDRFYFFKLVVDYNTGRYASFQFDKETWDLSEHKLMVFEPDIAHDPTPAMFELNVRLITYDDYDGPFHCRAIIDDVQITAEDR